MTATIETIDINLGLLIDKVLNEKSANNDRDYNHFHPSEFHQCHRKLIYKYYQAKGICKASNPQPISAQLQRIFDNGHHVHFRLGANMERTGILKGVWVCLKCSEEYGVDEKLGIHKPKECKCGHKKLRYKEVGFYDEKTFLGGHVDVILDLRGAEVPKDTPEELGHLVVDFKSMNTHAFRKLAAPKPEHNSQMQIYLYLSGLKFGKFLYEDKNDQSFKEFLVRRDDKFIDAQVSSAVGLKKVVTCKNTNGEWTLPVRAHAKHNTKECVECPFRSHCWNLK